MPHFYFREVWTPLKVVGVRLFKDGEGKLWYKVLANRRRRLRRVGNESDYEV